MLAPRKSVEWKPVARIVTPVGTGVEIGDRGLRISDWGLGLGMATGGEGCRLAPKWANLEDRRWHVSRGRARGDLSVLRLHEFSVILYASREGVV